MQPRIISFHSLQPRQSKRLHTHDLEEQSEAVVADQASVDEVASSILSRHLEAFKELAK